MFVLASASPRRRDLLREAGFRLEIRPSAIEERPWAGEKPESYALRLAFEKAFEIAARGADSRPVLAADTIVTLEDRILEKPVDTADAIRMLSLLSGRTHRVITAICLVTRRNGLLHTRGEAVATGVTFHDLSREAIEAYAASGEPMDKAGAYAIQGGAASMVKAIVGSYTNVVGLPMERVTELLASAGIRPETAASSPSAP